MESYRWAYDVYVSFTSQDIRKTFIDHFFSDLKRKGIHVYGDNNQLNRDREDDALYKTIEQSRILLVIFSTNYASSTLCLKELVKIIECKESDEDIYEIWPIFYDVTPATVRNQTGSYQEAMMKHEIFNKKEVFKWKKALTFIGNLSGWDLQNTTNGHEPKFIDIISKEIFYKLIDGPIHVGNNLVGLDARVDQMNLQRFVGLNKVHMIGICGIGGIGKTTLAKAIYNLMYKHFEACSFCEDVNGNVNQNGLVHLQRKLLDDIIKNEELKIQSVGKGMKGKTVFIVLDDVDHQNHFEALAGNGDRFSDGSMVIVTSRDRQLLEAIQVEEIYEIALLNDDEASELFSKYAFRDKKPQNEVIKLTKIILQYVNGLPLALKTFGGFMFNKTINEWGDEIDKLQSSPHVLIQKVLRVLRVSYDGLDFDQKNIFLDIACFFKGEKKDFVVKIFDEGEMFLATNLQVLKGKSLITICEDRIQMHNLVQEMGRQIVREESEDIGKRSRLWSPIDVIDVLKNDKGTELVKGLALDLSSSEVNICSQSFTKLKNLRLLYIYIGDVSNFRDTTNSTIKCKVNNTTSGKLDFLSNELELLCWHGYPFQHLPSSFYPESLFVIDLSYSCINQIWSGSKGFKNLTSLNLSLCPNLRKTPDFTQTPNLKELILNDCENLVEIHPSIRTLNILTLLNLKNCKNLNFFPNITELESLKHLILSNCSKMVVPSSLFSLSSFLRKFRGPVPLVLPSLSALGSLRVLNVSNLNLSGVGLSNLESLCSLEELDMSGNDFTMIDANFSRLFRLSCLSVIGCKKLQFLPKLPSSIVKLYAQNCISLVELPKLSTMYNGGTVVFDFMMCQKVVENQTIESLLMVLLPQERIDIFEEVHIFLPGSKLPGWINNQSMGDCITLDSCHKKSKGLTICAVITPQNPGTVTTCFEISSSVKNLDGDVIADVSLSVTDHPDIASDQIWLSYRRSGPRWKNVIGKIMVLFKCVGVNCKVKQCGVRVVCEEDEQQVTSGSNTILTEDEPSRKKFRVL